MRNSEDLVDRIYEAAFVPDNWHSVLDDLAESVEGHGTSLIDTSSPRTRFIASRSLEDMRVMMIDEGWAMRNTRADKLLSIDLQGFVNEADYLRNKITTPIRSILR